MFINDCREVHDLFWIQLFIIMKMHLMVYKQIILPNNGSKYMKMLAFS